MRNEAFAGQMSMTPSRWRCRRRSVTAITEELASRLISSDTCTTRCSSPPHE
jgi:hypothetical protein